ncbi:MAG: hypothetical protein MUO26_14210, partial [Methanotrichaceae archaeon]|nr:hypothetical protein [Methanotrichaceae archaeon]
MHQIKEIFKTRNERASNLKRAIDLVWNSAPTWTSLNIIIIIVSGLLGLVSLFMTKYIIDAVTIAIGNTEVLGSMGTKIILLIILAFVIALAIIILNSIKNLVTMKQSQAVTLFAQNVIHSKSIEVDLEYYENSSYYDSLHLAQQEASYRPNSVVNKLVQLGFNGFSLITLIGLLTLLNWRLSIILFLAAIPGVIVRLLYANKEYKWLLKNTETERRMRYFDWLIIGGYHAKEIRMFNLGPIFKCQFANLKSKIFNEKFELTKSRSIADFFAQTSTTLALFSALAFFAYSTVQGIITIGGLVMYYQAFQRAQGILDNIFSSLNGLYADNLFLSNLFEFMDLK